MAKPYLGNAAVNAGKSATLNARRECGRAATINLRVDAGGSVGEGAQTGVGRNDRDIEPCRGPFIERLGNTETD